MNNTDWVLIDTETTGLTAPIMVVELAAQRMRGCLSVISVISVFSVANCF